VNISIRHPEIHALVLGDDLGALPAAISLSMGLFVGPDAYIAGPSM